MQRLRKQDLFKSPGVAETLDWAAALTELDAVALDPAQVSDTLGVLLKYQDDIAKIEGAKAHALIEETRAELRRDGAWLAPGGTPMTYDFKLSCTLPASPEAVYDAWLDSACHGAMTGAPATIGKRVGEPYAAWDGYITGKTLELVPGRRIVQSWRTSEFADADPDFDDRRRPRADQGPERGSRSPTAACPTARPITRTAAGGISISRR